ncbi:MAG: hypothetical protein ACFFBD_14340, partial [Candidatus Hodarchaeota archaeon]
MAKKPYGSGYFGEWIEDEFGLPAYRYTCNQINDPKAITPLYETWRLKTDQLHEVGNDRLVGVASNYGYIQVRQDEGSPKYLNDYNPERHQFAGGFGYLTDGKEVISTFYSGQSDSFDRIFGMGYYRKKVTGKGLVANQVVFAPFGDDPLLISQVTIVNQRQESVNLRWIEYWGCQMYQFSYKSFMLSLASKSKSTSDIRRSFSERFKQKFSLIEGGAGLVATKRFTGLKISQKVAWTGLQLYLSQKGKDLTGGKVKSPVREAVLEDLNPPPTFLVSLDAPVDGWTTNGAQFFGKGGVESPEGLQNPLSSDLTPSGTAGGMFLERKLHLDPGEQQTIYFAYGYIPEGLELKSLLAKYQEKLPNLLS